MDPRLEAAPKATTEATTREFANSVRASSGTWIGSADSKATALAAVAGAIFAIVLTGTAGASANLRKGELLSIAMFSLFMMCSVIGAAAVLWPRTNRQKILRKSGHDKPLKNSPTYFGDLAKMSYAAFVEMANNPPAADVEDSLEQAYVIAKIASSKMSWMKFSVANLVLSLISLGILIIAEVYSRL